MHVKPRHRHPAFLLAALLLALCALLLATQPASAQPLAAASGSAKIVSAATGDGRVFKAFALGGGGSEALEARVPGYPSGGARAAWSCEPAGVVDVEGTGPLSCTVRPLSEGSAVLSVTVTLADGTELSDEAGYAVYAPAGEQTAGETARAAELSRSPVRLRPDIWSRGSIGAGEGLDVVGRCGAWYYVRPTGAYEFTDGLASPYAFIPGECVRIPVESIDVSGPSELSVGESGELTATVHPALATDGEVTWSVDGNAVLSEARGAEMEVTGVRKGVAGVEARAGGISVQASVSVIPTTPALKVPTKSEGVWEWCDSTAGICVDSKKGLAYIIRYRQAIKQAK